MKFFFFNEAEINHIFKYFNLNESLIDHFRICAFLYASIVPTFSNGIYLGFGVSSSALGSYNNSRILRSPSGFGLR